MAFFPPVNLKDPEFIMNQIRIKVDRARHNRSVLEQEWDKDLKLYLGQKPKKVFPWAGCANQHIPLAHTFVESLVPRAQASIFDVEPVAMAVGRGPEDDNKAELIQKFLDWEINEEMNLEELSQDWFRDAFIYGTGVAKIAWEKTLDEFGEPIERMKMVPIPLNKFLVPNGSTANQEPEFYVQEILTTYDELLRKQKVGVYKNVDKVIPTVPEPESDNHLKLTFDDFQKTQDTAPGKDKQIRIWEYHGKLPVVEDSNGQTKVVRKEVILTFAPDSRVILKAVHNILGKRPFYFLRYIKLPHRFYGLGLCRQIRDTNLLLDSLYNMRLDNGAIATMKVYKYRAGSGHNPAVHKVFPGAAWPVDDMGDVQPLEFGDVKASSFNEQETLLALAQRLTGVTDISLGLVGSSSVANNQTATGFSIAQAESNLRFKGTIKSFKREFKRMFRDILSYNQMFRDQEVFVRILGTDGSLISAGVDKNSLRFKGDIILSAQTDTQNPEVQFQRALQAYNLAIANPLLANNPSALFHVTRELFKPLGLKNVDKILPPQLLQQLQAPDAIQQIRNAEDENDAMATGQPVQVQPIDDHKLHMRKHIEELEQIPQEFQSLVEAHLQEHQAAMQEGEQGGPGLAPGGASSLTNTPLPNQ